MNPPFGHGTPQASPFAPVFSASTISSRRARRGSTIPATFVTRTISSVASTPEIGAFQDDVVGRTFRFHGRRDDRQGEFSELRHRLGLRGKMQRLKKVAQAGLALQDDMQEEVVRQNTLKLVARAVRVTEEGAK